MKQIRIIGIGSGSVNILNRIILNKELKRKLIDDNITFCMIDSDKNFLDLSSAKEKLLIEIKQDKNGFKANFKEAEETALSYVNEIKTIIKNPDILIIISTLGGITGSGVTPLVIKLAKEKKTEVIPIVSIPFEFEGRKRFEAANSAIEKINDYVQDYIVIKNDEVTKKIKKEMKIKEALSIIDNEIVLKTEEIKYKYSKGFNI